MIIIAHRLSTLDMCDRIMVIQDGEMKGFDAPSTLEQSSDFYREALALSGDALMPLPNFFILGAGQEWDDQSRSPASWTSSDLHPRDEGAELLCRVVPVGEESRAVRGAIRGFE